MDKSQRFFRNLILISVSLALSSCSLISKNPELDTPKTRAAYAVAEKLFNSQLDGWSFNELTGPTDSFDYVDPDSHFDFTLQDKSKSDLQVCQELETWLTSNMTIKKIEVWETGETVEVSDFVNACVVGFKNVNYEYGFDQESVLYINGVVDGVLVTVLLAEWRKAPIAQVTSGSWL